MIVIFIIIAVLLLILISLFTSSEISLISSRQGKIRSMNLRGTKTALLVLKNTENTLSVLLVGTNICVVAISSIASKIVMKNASENFIFLTTIITTFTVLILGEIIPKSISYRNPSYSLVRLSGFIYISSFILKPISNSMKFISTYILKFLNIKEIGEDNFSTSDMENALKESATIGILPPHAKRLADGIDSINKLKAILIMKPRTHIAYSHLKDGDPGIIEAYKKSGQGKILLVGENIDDVLGIVYISDLLKKKSFQHVRKPIFIFEQTSFKKIIEIFKENPQTDMIIVVDEFGQVSGIITKADVIFAISGIHLVDDENPFVVGRDKNGRYIFKGDTKIELIENLLDIKTGINGQETLSSCILSKIGKIPDEKEIFSVGKLVLEIYDRTSKSIKSVKLLKF